MTEIAELIERGVIEASGEDRVGFLQGLVSNDVALAAPGAAIWAGLLTPQGKYLADFFVFAEADRLLLDCEAAQVADLVQKLARFRLRAKVLLRDVSHELAVYAGWDGAPTLPGAALDPRLPAAGWRALAPHGLATNASATAWDAHRLALGLPDGTRDMEVDKTVLLEAGFDELHGISWTKGCYMGQELTARTRYRGLLKRRLVRVLVDGPLPVPGTPVLQAGREVGTMRSGLAQQGLAVLRLDSLAGSLECGGAMLHPQPADWRRPPEPAG